MLVALQASCLQMSTAGNQYLIVLAQVTASRHSPLARAPLARSQSLAAPLLQIWWRRLKTLHHRQLCFRCSTGHAKRRYSASHCNAGSLATGAAQSCPALASKLQFLCVSWAVLSTRFVRHLGWVWEASCCLQGCWGRWHALPYQYESLPN